MDEDEYVVLPRDTSTARRVVSVLAAIVLVIGLFAGGGLLWASKQINPSGPQGLAVEKVVIPAGSSTASIGQILADKDIIASSRIFAYYVGWKNGGPWKAGEYVDFRKSSSFDEAIEVLDAGPIAAKAKVVRVTEGLRLADALKEIESQMGTVTVADLQAALDSGQVKSSYKPAELGSWEGFLFPDTYEFDEKDTAPVILQKMATKMDSVLDELGYDKADRLAGRSALELVTIASLIEKEAGYPPEERGKIS
ncbi:MAG TPA: endolytic transglycosylase MltG, partial [Microthrixaceae bacterium]|nr:endolytic transglycosylase MltG [Microthrixaceae bacterium]